MRLLRFYLGIFCAAVWVGCGPPLQGSLEKVLAGLKGGMKRQDVQQLFGGIPAHESVFDSPGGFAAGPSRLVLFQTNVTRGTEWTYVSAEPLLESCRIFFDTNGVIVGYQYSHD
jgi:hypothetical protein